VASEGALVGDGSSDETDPRVFVTILLFDKNYNFLDVAYQQLASTSGWGSLTASYTVKQAGYAYMYVSNEQQVLMDVYFDDVTMTYTPSPVVQQEDFYPFGATFNSYQRENTVPNKYLFNGKELQTDLSLNMEDFGARMYDPYVGRFSTIDPHSVKYDAVTPYNFGFNNPVLFVDPTGKDGVVTGSGTKDDPYVVKANYYYVKGGLSKNELKGLNSAISTYNGAGGKNGVEVKNADGSTSYVKFNLSTKEVGSLDEAKKSAAGDSFKDTGGQERSFGNIVGTNPSSGDEYGSATSSQVNVNQGNVEAGVKDGANEASLLKGTFIHEIGHNLGGEHSDGTATMQNVIKTTRTSDISTGNGNSSTSYSYPTLTNKFTSVIFQRRDTRNQGSDSFADPGLYTKKKE